MSLGFIHSFIVICHDKFFLLLLIFDAGVKGLVRIIRTTSETATEQKGTRRKLLEPSWQPMKKEAKVAGRHEARMCVGETA